MAPIAVDNVDLRGKSNEIDKKPTIFFMDSFHPAAVVRAQELFKVILPDNPEDKNWRNAEYLLTRSSPLMADGIADCPWLRAIGKQGVGTDKIDMAVCLQRGIKILKTPVVNARAVAELVLS